MSDETVFGDICERLGPDQASSSERERYLIALKLYLLGSERPPLCAWQQPSEVDPDER